MTEDPDWSLVVPGNGSHVPARERFHSQESPLLQIGLTESAQGCVVRLMGDLIRDTTAGLLSIEPMLANETRVALDVSGVTSIDGAGLEATLRLIHAIHAFGGRLTIGPGQSVDKALEGLAPSFGTGEHNPTGAFLGRLTIQA